MKCSVCGHPHQAHSSFCLACGAATTAGAAPEPAHQPAASSPGGWVASQYRVSFVAVSMSVTCNHCSQPVPLNGPTQLAHCDNCMKDSPLGRQFEELCLAAEGSQQLGSAYNTNLFKSAAAQCSKCDQDVPIDQYLGHHGATTTIPCPSCGTGLPTFPCPAWLKEELPMALQVFGGDAETANKQAGMALQAADKAQPIVMACPNCGGGLKVGADAERTTTCHFCQASVFLPDELWKRLHPVRTMEKWTLTYNGALKTKEDLKREADREQQRKDSRQERKQERHERQQEAMKAQKSSRARTIIGIIVLVALVGVMAFVSFYDAIAGLFSETGGSSVKGSFKAKGKLLTTFKMKPNACRSGERKNFQGVFLYSKKDNQAIKVVEDPVKGMLVGVQIPSSCTGNSCKMVTFGEESCSTFDVAVSRTDATFNHVRVMKGHMNITCKFKGGEGTAKAKLTFKGCN
jgi:hypothetical protein